MTEYQYSGTCVRVIDGDTVVLQLSRTFTQEVDFGFYVKDVMTLTKTAQVTFRLYGINTPEVIGPDKAKGLVAKAVLEEIMGKTLRVLSYKTDKYGRWLARVFISQADGSEVDVSQHLLDHGFATIYDGHGTRT